MKPRLTAFTVLIAASLVAGAVELGAQAGFRIRIGTIVPKGSLWDETLQDVGQRWQRILGPRLKMQIYAGGVLGDEADMIRKVRAGELQAVGLSSVGLSRIDSGVSCLQVPMMLASYDELDYVRDRLAPLLERRIEREGFKVLHWADGGWVYAFTKQPVRTPDDLRRLKLFTSAGDPETEKLYKELGFHVVPLSLADMIPSLQRGMIDSFATVPLFAQLQETYKLAPHMTDVRWTPLVGGTVIGLKIWESLPAEHRSAMLEAAQAAGTGLRGRIRAMDTVAIQEMRKRGLKVVEVDSAGRRAWDAEAEKAYPRLRDRYCPAEIFDEVKRLRDESRARKS
jgi:TRAP-type C4-dicarboxylate transport system substrate-binding protein